MDTAELPIATPQQRQAIRRNQMQRLRNQAEALLRAVEDLEPPKTYKDAEQAAKALLAVGKVLDAVYAHNGDDERYMPAGNHPPDPQAEREALATWKAVLDHHLDALAAVRQRRRDDARQTDPPKKP